jgi:hypothetical protein
MFFKQITGEYTDVYDPMIPPKSITIAKNWDVWPQKFVTLDSILFHLVCYLLVVGDMLALRGNTALAMEPESTT